MKVISGFKGTLDFYVHMGQICVRSWPRSPGPHRAPAVQASWPAFTWASQNWNSMDPELQEAFKRMASGTVLSGRDIFMKCYLNSSIVHLE